MSSPNEFGKNVFLLRLGYPDEGDIFLRGMADGTHVHVQELVAPTSMRNVNATGVVLQVRYHCELLAASSELSLTKKQLKPFPMVSNPGMTYNSFRTDMHPLL